jgi:Cu2+-exporting ATPase
VTALPIRSGESPLQTTMLLVPAMHCAGCMAKVERGLGDVPGVNAARVNLTARQVRVEHDPAVAIPQLVDALANAGFASQPRGEEMVPPPSAVKPLLAPLAMAGFACMNVMLMSVGIWSGADGATRDMFHWLSALIGVPAILYAGMPFFTWPGVR